MMIRFILVVLLTFSSFLVKSDDTVMTVDTWTNLLGPKLYKWADNRENIEEWDIGELMKGKTAVALYFSASWCGPCRNFTPQLVEYYTRMKKKHKNKFELIWISGDRSADDFVAYYQKMPWLAVPVGSASQINAKISPTYGVKGIPHLVFLDGYDASIFTTDGRTAVAKDPYGLEFPYKPRTLMALLPRPIKKLIKAQMDSFKLFLQGMLESMSPKRVIARLLNMGKPQTQAA
jgi:thiol-disulfide isomerase/thioredoxin